jgi:hypothetical protein
MQWNWKRLFNKIDNFEKGGRINLTAGGRQFKPSGPSFFLFLSRFRSLKVALVVLE